MTVVARWWLLWAAIWPLFIAGCGRNSPPQQTPEVVAPHETARQNEIIVLSDTPADWASPLVEAVAKTEGASTATEQGALVAELDIRGKTFALSDYQEQAGFTKRLGESPPPAAAVLVVSAPHGMTKGLEERLRAVKEANVDVVAVLMDHVDTIDDQELLDLVEMEIQQTFDALKLLPPSITRGSTRLVVEGDEAAQEPIQSFWERVEMAVNKEG